MSLSDQDKEWIRKIYGIEGGSIHLVKRSGLPYIVHICYDHGQRWDYLGREEVVMPMVHEAKAAESIQLLKGLLIGLGILALVGFTALVIFHEPSRRQLVSKLKGIGYDRT